MKELLISLLPNIIDAFGLIIAAFIAVVGIKFTYDLNRVQRIDEDRFGVVRHIYGYMVILDNLEDYEEAKKLSRELLWMIAIHYPDYCNEKYINIESISGNATPEKGVKCCRDFIKNDLREIIKQEHKRLNTI